jgi:hypothetical protein
VKAAPEAVARLLLWDYERGGTAYDVLCLAMLLVIFLVPDLVWNDPLQVRP